MTTTVSDEQALALAREVISEEEIQILNSARRILKTLEKRGSNLSFDPRYSDEDGRFADSPRPYTLGRFVEAADRAEYCLFNVLNTASSMCHVPIAENDLIRRGEEQQ